MTTIDQQIAEQWAAAKVRQLANGYATQWDRRTARQIRQREKDGIEITAEQRNFAEQVESIVAGEKP